MWARVVLTYAFSVGVMGGAAYLAFPWYGTTAWILLAVVGALAGGIALLIVHLTRGLNSGGGGSTSGGAQRQQSKGARER